MNDWVTIATFHYAHQAALLKGRIESEDILCNIKDELTATTNPFYFGAIGGVKVQVRENDVQKVIPILRDVGYPIDDDGSYETLIKKVVRFTQKLPLINKYPLETRYTILIAAMVLLIGIICYASYLLTARS
jgi:hypothetical protein